MSLALGVLAALAAGVRYSVGVTLQSVEARQAPDEESLRVSLIRRLATRPRWLRGTGCVFGIPARVLVWSSLGGGDPRSVGTERHAEHLRG